MGKKVKATCEKYYPSREAGGQFCNIPPIYEEMVLRCLFTYIITRRNIYNSFSKGNGKKIVKATWE